MFSQVKKVKEVMTPELMCVDESIHLYSFVKEIFAYEYKQVPDYAKLKHLLGCILLQKEIIPNLKFDWSKFNPRVLAGLMKSLLVQTKEEHTKVAEEIDAELEQVP